KPDKADAFLYRGSAYLVKNEYDLAVHDFEQVIRLEPNNADAFIGRGSCYGEKEDYERALQDVDHAFHLKNYGPTPEYAYLLANTGSYHFFLGQFAAAREDLAFSLLRNPNSPYAVIWLYLAQTRVDWSQGRVTLEKNAAPLKLTDWPGPIISF